jgi:hypothetical protein
MRTIEMLDLDDTLQEDDWVRPIVFLPFSTQGEIAVNSTSCYSGRPINHPKWIRARRIFGECWFGKKIRKVDSKQEYEFIRGDVPSAHQF